MSYMVAVSPARAFIPQRKPMIIARRVSLFQREIRISLSSAAIELLFDLASVLSEGDRAGDAFYGSTMITFDLARAAPSVSEVCDAAVARQLGERLAADPRVTGRARALAVAEAERIAGSCLIDPAVDLRTRVSGAHIELDIDVEARVGALG